MAIVPPSKTMKTRPQSTSRTETTPGKSQFWRGRQLISCSVDSSKSYGSIGWEGPSCLLCWTETIWPWHPGAVNLNVLLSVSIFPLSCPTLLVFPLRLRQSDLFISSTSPLSSFTVPGTDAPMPWYRYVTPPPPPPPPPLLRAHASIRSLHPPPPPPYLFYHTWHRGTDVSLSRYRYVTPFLPTLFSVLPRKPIGLASDEVTKLSNAWQRGKLVLNKGSVPHKSMLGEKSLTWRSSLFLRREVRTIVTTSSQLSASHF